MDAAHYITLIKDTQETVPNMMEAVVTSLWKTDAGPATVHKVLLNAPSLATFFMGVNAMLRGDKKSAALAILQDVNEHNRDSNSPDKESIQTFLNAAMAPAPLRFAEPELGENYWANNRAHDNQRPEDEVRPLTLGPAQLTLSLSLDRRGIGGQKYIPPSKPAAALGSGWECIPRDGEDGVRMGEAAHTGPQRESIQALNAMFDTANHAALLAKLSPIARIIFFRNMEISDEDIACVAKDVVFGSTIDREIRNILMKARQQIQNRIWASPFFKDWVEAVFEGKEGIDAATYNAMTSEAKHELWEGRVDLEFAKNVFRALDPVDLTTAWADTSPNGWRQHMKICIGVAAHATFKAYISCVDTVSVKDRRLRLYATIRAGPNRYLPNRPGLDRVPLLVASQRQNAVADDGVDY